MPKIWDGTTVRILREELGEDRIQFAARFKIATKILTKIEHGYYSVTAKMAAQLDQVELLTLGKRCNYANCEAELLGESMVGWLHEQTAQEQERQPPIVAGRIHGRPYCHECLAAVG